MVRRSAGPIPNHQINALAEEPSQTLEYKGSTPNVTFVPLAQSTPLLYAFLKPSQIPRCELDSASSQLLLNLLRIRPTDGVPSPFTCTHNILIKIIQKKMFKRCSLRRIFNRPIDSRRWLVRMN